MRQFVSKIRCREIEEDTPKVNSGLHAHMHVSTHIHCTHTQRKEGNKKGGRKGGREKEEKNVPNVFVYWWIRKTGKPLGCFF